ncbi:uncharacterized protein LOC123291667 [Chrysoperla carnea]|uniref:uncharacterized protein LOC123291667 n=1 Tax=Chrysoperla carnea TaxID=189513 RepID=UPI001D0622DE|nr:uncharacterized protein LOC123291667 [Chrysoperla carnea]
MMDASSKSDSGYLNLNVADFGSFDECINIEIDFQTQNNTIFGKYCLIMFNASVVFEPRLNQFNKSLHLWNKQEINFMEHFIYKNTAFEPIKSVCVPNRCTKNDVKILVHNNFYNSLSPNVFYIDQCQTLPNYPKIDSLDVIAILFPVVLIVFLFYITLGKFCGYGPFYLDNIADVEYWRNKAWAQILGVANFYIIMRRTASISHFWYVQCDSQLYLFTPIAFLIYTKRSKKSGLVFMGITLLTSIITVLACGYLVTACYNVHSREYFDLLYKMPYFRANPWIMGLICAYFFTQITTSPLKSNSKIKIYSCWIITLLIMSFAFFGETPIKLCADCQIFYVYYDTFVNIFWSLAIFWLIIYCYHINAEANAKKLNFDNNYCIPLTSKGLDNMQGLYNTRDF